MAVGAPKDDRSIRDDGIDIRFRGKDSRGPARLEPTASHDPLRAGIRGRSRRELLFQLGKTRRALQVEGQLTFADAFEARFVSQGENEDRSIFDTLALAWDVLSVLPPEALTRVTEEELTRHHRFGASRKDASAVV